MRKVTYEYIENFVNEFEECKLITSKDEFKKMVESGVVPSEVKLLFMCKCGNTFERRWGKLKCKRFKCSDCVQKQRAASKRISMEEVQSRLDKVGLKYSRGKIENHGSRFYVICPICGKEFDTCLYTVAQNISQNKKMNCQQCSIQRQKNMFKTPFNVIKEYFEERGCTLLSTEDDYENSSSKLTYIARCGHVNTTSWAGFQNSKHYVRSECKKKLCTGEKAYNWNGGSSSKIRKNDYEYKQWRSQVFKRDNYTCQCCGARGGRLNAHHIDGKNWCNEKRTDVDNGICLCEDCHKKFHMAYGYGNNTKQQFEEFMKNNKNNDFSCKDIPFDNIKNSNKKRIASNAKKVVCIETGDIFNSIKDASEWCHGNIKGFFKGKQKYAGKHPDTGEKLHWMYYEE